MRSKWVILLLLVTSVVATTTATLNNQKQSNSPKSEKKKFDKAEFESQFPIVDYIAPEPPDPIEREKRRTIGKKHDKANIRINERADTITDMGDWESGLPALPVAQSKIIVMGEITDAQAYLSNDKTGVYSEFTVRIDEILKNDTDVSLSPGASFSVERSGGRVRFPSGHVTLQVVRGQGMPRKGQRYVLFLTGNSQEEGFSILTGYELRGGRVFPLDNPGGGTHPMASYKEAEEESFLKNIRDALTKL